MQLRTSLASESLMYFIESLQLKASFISHIMDSEQRNIPETIYFIGMVYRKSFFFLTRQLESMMNWPSPAMTLYDQFVGKIKKLYDTRGLCSVRLRESTFGIFFKFLSSNAVVTFLASCL